MSENANQSISRTGSENGGNGGHFDPGARRNNPSGNRNNRRRRPSQQIGGEQSANHSQRPAVNNSGAPVQQGAPSGRPQNQAARADSYQQRRGSNRPQRPNQVPGTPAVQGSGNSASGSAAQNVSRGTEKPEHKNERQIPAAKIEKTENQAFGNQKNTANQPPRTERPREPRTWARNIRTEETHEDIHRDNERIEKEIWLEIASIHTYKLD